MVDDHWAARHDRNKVDLAFIVDCTGSMGLHIKQAQKHVRSIAETVSRTAFNVKLGLVEYRDHPPQDNSFITKVHDFTHSVEEMKKWVDGMSARGGGDGPESVACALDAASKLSYRKDATKICVLIADAPPHGLGLEHDGFPDGCPTGNDPFKSCRAMVEKGIVLYCVGCEPNILRYKDFFMCLAYITGGQYVPLSKAQGLSKVIINASLEEVAHENIMGYVEDFLNMVLEEMKAKKQKVTVDDLADKLQEHLNLRSVKSRQLQCNSAELQPPTPTAKSIAGVKKLSQVQQFLKKDTPMDYRSFYMYNNVTVEVTITEPAEVTKNLSERLLIKALGRQKIPVEHDEETGEITIEPFMSGTSSAV